MNAYLLVGLGGALGAMGRHAASRAAVGLGAVGWPWGTFAVNAVGGLAMGVLVGWLALQASGPGSETARDWRLFLGVGVLGGFTTFSAFALETAEMVRTRDLTGAALYALGSVMVCVTAVFLGVALIRRVAA